jgi:hypothetical protein
VCWLVRLDQHLVLPLLNHHELVILSELQGLLNQVLTEELIGVQVFQVLGNM